MDMLTDNKVLTDKFPISTSPSFMMAGMAEVDLVIHKGLLIYCTIKDIFSISSSCKMQTYVL